MSPLLPWLTPMSYNDGPMPAPNTGVVDVDPDPIDYSAGPNRNQVFGEDIGDDGDDAPMYGSGEEIDS